ncbi:hypothetical protein D3C71_1712550 [compost metagenome]
MVHSFSSMPSREGATIIQNRLFIMGNTSRCTSAPTRTDRTPGTMNGDSSVSIRMIDSVMAMLPR